MNMTAFEKFDHEVIDTQKRCDKLKSELEKKEKQLYDLEDTYLDLKKIAEGVNNKNNPQMKVIIDIIFYNNNKNYRNIFDIYIRHKNLK